MNDQKKTIRVEIQPRFQQEINMNQGDRAISMIARRSFYWLEIDDKIEEQKLNAILQEVFCDPLLDQWVTVKNAKEQDQTLLAAFDSVVEVSFLHGVTDNSARSAKEALELLDLKAQVYSGQLFFFKGDQKQEEVLNLVQEHFANKLIQKIKAYAACDFLTALRWSGENFKSSSPTVNVKQNEVVHFDLLAPFEDWKRWSKERCWAFSDEEILHLLSFYRDEDQQKRRKSYGLSGDPSDVEVEMIAQTWSEHCKHKIFSAEIDFEDQDSNKTIINGLFKSYIKSTTEKIIKDDKIDWAISLFSDNAGIVRFDPQIDLCLKVETHNSPSALDPYGGALTGILGVNRDILGTGMGAKPVANLDVFCLSSFGLDKKDDLNYWPSGVALPRSILEGVHKGVEDGGNKSGIPTVAGAYFFDEDYAAKPLIFVGTLGVIPPEIKFHGPSAYKKAQKDDLIVVIGGAVGRDGIHGATMSSMEQNPDTPSSAVQIGDPLTQKRVMDFILKARDLGLYHSITDNGAGGISSSIGEMARESNGARIDLDLNPLKYPGLKPWEILVSEGQERMSLAVDAKKWEAFYQLACDFNVKAHKIGQFKDHGLIEIYYQEKCVGLMPLDFLHESLPKMKLKAKWTGVKERRAFGPKKEKIKLADVEAKNLKQVLPTMLARPSVCSKEKWVRRYDHEVGAATVARPFTGPSLANPNNGGGLWSKALGGSEDNCFLLGLGLAPLMSLVDPYAMALQAHDEAIRNLVVMGADPNQVAVLDNFCWPDPIQSEHNPMGEYRLAQLVKTCQGLAQSCLDHATPLISGKDSMKNNFRGQNRQGDELSFGVLPTLLVTALGKASRSHLCTSEVKASGDQLYWLKACESSLMGSQWQQVYTGPDEKGPLSSLAQQKDGRFRHQFYQQFHQGLRGDLIKSAHDISEGGFLVALCEKIMNSGFGAYLDLKHLGPLSWSDFFGEGMGQILVSVAKEKRLDFEAHFKNYSCLHLGEVNNSNHLIIKAQNQIEEFEVVWNEEDLVRAWSKGF